MSIDSRGSENQRILYSMLSELYPGMDIVYEYPLENNQRIDIFIPNIGLAIEYDGEQHFKYIEAWHKDINGFINQKKSDFKKDDLLYSMGIKLVRIPFDKMISNSLELKNLIDSVEYPDVEYSVPTKEKKQIDEYSLRRKEYRKQIYRRMKEVQNAKRRKRNKR